jgi:hypothetical protein
MSENISDLIEEIRASQRKTLEALTSLKQVESESLSADIEAIQETEKEIIGEIESLIGNKTA